MKLHLVKKGTIDEYVTGHSGSKPAFHFWLDSLKYTDWGKPTDIKETFNSADLLGKNSDRVVF
jgi:mRNA interferase HigB